MKGTALSGCLGSRKSVIAAPVSRACCKVSGFDARKHREPRVCEHEKQQSVANFSSVRRRARVNIYAALARSLCARPESETRVRDADLFFSPHWEYFIARSHAPRKLYLYVDRPLTGSVTPDAHGAPKIRACHDTRYVFVYIYTRAISLSVVGVFIRFFPV